MTTIKLDPGAALLLDALHGAGHAAYAVGGCVRDSLLGLDPHDWDLCTSARPEQVMALFGEEKCIPTGLQHGTVTVKQSPKALLNLRASWQFNPKLSATLAVNNVTNQKYWANLDYGNYADPRNVSVTLRAEF